MDLVSGGSLVYVLGDSMAATQVAESFGVAFVNESAANPFVRVAMALSAT